MGQIVVRGARQHNLKGVDATIPREKLVVITGLSGSGKSSLAFDTIYAEGQRRYVESLSTYARQFLDRLARPDVDLIEGLSPAIAIEQKNLAKNPRSTVGTVTEILDYLRLLYARVGCPHCPDCGAQLARQSPQEMVEELFALADRSRLTILAPVVRSARGSFTELFEGLRKDGFTRLEIDGESRDLGDEISLAPGDVHDVDVVIDRVLLKREARSRLSESIELALHLADGLVKIASQKTRDADRELRLLSERLVCEACDVSVPELTPRLFSFNNPRGACPRCGGLGVIFAFEEELLVPDPERSLAEGAIECWDQRNAAYYQQQLEQLAEACDFTMVTPYGELPATIRHLLMRGSGDEELTFSYQRAGKEAHYRRRFEGVIPNMERRLAEQQRRQKEGGEPEAFDQLLEEFDRFLQRHECTECGGARLRREALAVRLGGKNIAQVTALDVRAALDFFAGLEVEGSRRQIAEKLVAEVRSRLAFLEGVGLTYLSLDRPSSTLSGGEGQRVRLATQIGASLMGVLYVLDEPSIGLHQRDNQRLLDTLRRLRDQGNTVLVVEHDEETIRAADFIVDLGPGAGVNGGEVVACGHVDDVLRSRRSVTGHYLAGRRRIERPSARRPAAERHLVLRGGRHHNLRGIDVSFPLGRLICVSGVSGSGKSSLVVDTLLPALRRELYGSRDPIGDHDRIEGVAALDKVVAIDQRPIGRTPRSNAATYTGVFTLIRELFAGVPEARMRGHKPGRFSFNVKGGRCEACRGDGAIRVEMHFLPDMYVTCEICGGARYNEETLRISYKGKSIAEVLALSIDEGREFFHNVPRLRERLETLSRVGLGYLALGQSATTLSGGEAQRIKLSKELSRRASGRTLYLLDEPTTGLHFADVDMLLAVLDELVGGGNTVVVIEHNLDMIRCADHVIDLGPEGGTGGGAIVAEGTPEQIAAAETSHTGRYLRRALERS